MGTACGKYFRVSCLSIVDPGWLMISYCLWSFTLFKYLSWILMLWIVTLQCRWLGHYQVVAQWPLRSDGLCYPFLEFHPYFNLQNISKSVIMFLTAKLVYYLSYPSVRVHLSCGGYITFLWTIHLIGYYGGSYSVWLSHFFEFFVLIRQFFCDIICTVFVHGSAWAQYSIFIHYVS